MEVRLNIHYDSVPRTASGPRTHDTRPTEEDFASESIGSPEAPFQAELDRSPDVRIEEVERGKSLVANPAYPPRKTLEGIAQLLALGFRTVQPNR
jgi:hypothetical protein